MSVLSSNFAIVKGLYLLFPIISTSIGAKQAVAPNDLRQKLVFLWENAGQLYKEARMQIVYPPA